MPTYEYECQKCGKRVDIFHKMNMAPLKVCPSCKGKLKKMISAGSGLIFKGSGFYITDYKKNKTSETKDKPVPKNASKK